MKPDLGRDGEGLPSLMAIGGMGRSGTTMLWSVCDSHPAIRLSKELRCLSYLGRSWFHCVRDLRKSWRADAIIRVPKQDLWRNSTAASGRFVAAFMLRLLMLTGWRRPVEAEDVREALHQMFRGASIVGDKRPYYLWQLGELTRIQNVLAVVIYRDCRDVVRSSLRMYESAWRGNEKRSSAKRIAEQWVEAVELMRRHADAIHTVRYEAFVTEPVTGVERLGQYLGVSPGGFQVEAVHARRVGKWQRELSRRQVDDVLAVAEPTLDRLGYSLSSPIST